MAGKKDIVEQALKLVMGAGEKAAPKAKLPMDLDNRMYRASEMGFDPTRRYYHLTRKDFDAFKLGADPSSHTGGGAIWLRDDPRNNISAHQVPSFEAEGARDIPLFIRPTKELPTMEWSLLRQQGKLNDQFPLMVTPEENKMLRDMGYSHASMGGETVVFDPKDLRSPHAVFDPDEIESADYMKASGGRIAKGPGGWLDDVVKMAGKVISGEGDDAAKAGIRAYHGTPHDFDKFEWSPKTRGTGEGAQAYGDGLYFAEREGVAKGYRDALSSDPTVILNTPYEGQQKFVSTNNGFVDNEGNYLNDLLPGGQMAAEAVTTYESPLGWKQLIRKQAKNDAEAVSAMQLLRKKTVVKTDPGSMYEVNIDADPNTFLDWDKPLSEQPEAVRKLFPSVEEAKLLDAQMENLSVDVLANPNDKDLQAAWDAAYRSPKHRMASIVLNEANPKLGGKFASGNQVYAAVAQNPSEASALLKEAGIPGIKFFDAGSRAAGEGTRNYVVFDDKLISIIRKYGIAGASAMLGYNLMEQLDPKQALAASMADQDYQASRPQRSMGGNNSISGALNVARGLNGGE